MNKNTKLYWGTFALILSAVMTVGGLFLRGPLIFDVSDAQAFAESVSSSNNLIAETFLPLSLVIQLFGFLGIYIYLDKPETAKPSFWGMVLSILGNGLLIPFAGTFAFAIPVVGKLYLEGYTGVIAVAEQSPGPGIAFAYLIASAFALMAGAILFAVSMRKIGLPLWLPAIYVIQAFGLSFGASIAYPFEVAGGLLLLVFTIAFGIKIWKHK